LVVGGAVGYAIALVVAFGPDEAQLGSVLINMSAFASFILYIVQMAAYLVLARDYQGLPRPYRSIVGPTGAMTALVTAAAALVLMFFNPTFRPGLYSVAAALLLGMAYYFAMARHQLVEAPEEAYAVRAVGALDRRRDDVEAADEPATVLTRKGAGP